MKTKYLITLVLCFTTSSLLAQSNWKVIGDVKSRSTNQIKSSNWIIGCETLDRDYGDYDAYKTYIVPLGIKRIRLQGGWAKCEKVKGVYDWKWLDHIIDDALSRGLEPWLELSYGNPIYEGGGGANLSAGLPTSQVALAAWDNWVRATVNHYKTRVNQWEIWNEPNNIKANTPQMVADLNIRTIKIIKSVQPKAQISAIALGAINVSYADECLKIMHAAGVLKDVDNITYHGYIKNPDAHYGDVARLRQTVDKYMPRVKIRQGENGAPSKGGMGGAIADYDWTELSQAKWDTRRMLGDLGHDIESSVFTLIDLAYNTDGPIKKLNVKGLIESDMSKKVIRTKLAYGSVQNVTSIFDDQLKRINDFQFTSNAKDSISLFAYQNKRSKKQVVSIWLDKNIPANENAFKNIDFEISNGRFSKPVYVDVITGKVTEIPSSQWKKKGRSYTFSQIPVYDGPILIIDKSLVTIK